ncbi:hypothetical protein chiPu_0002340 [Chiloscyllium punctatum]|uniref:Maestro-like HEAT-repeats domain-containing protein n=1 Tax=Chiloscyllium punctatum TaxID=137246 RepID=A0A401S0L3_CHIPU|nr:hypothetical protein [Chiloscyllium punctatum]
MMKPLICVFCVAMEKIIAETEDKDEIIQKIEEGILSMEDNKRETGVHIISEMPVVFSRCDDSREVLENPVSTLLGGLLPLCADSSQAVQRMALSAVSTIQSIHLVADGASLEQYQVSLVFLKSLPEDLIDPDEGAQFEKCHQVMELICQSLPRCQLDNLLLMVCGSLSDQHPSCARVASLLLENLFLQDRKQLQDRVSEILHVLGLHLEIIPHQEVKRCVLRGITALTSQHSAAAMSQLQLCRPPGDKFIRDVWRAAVEDRACPVCMIKHFMYSLEGKCCPFSGDMYSANVSLTAIHSLYEILTHPRMVDVVRTLFPHIFSGLLVSLTSGMSFSLPSDTDIQSQQRGFTAGFDVDTSRSLNERCARSLKALFDLIVQSDISGDGRRMATAMRSWI